MINKPDQRVAVFIDTQNMYHSAKHIYGARVNFATLVEAAASGRSVIRAIAYVAKSKTGEEQAFFEALTQNGIELKIKDVQEFASGQKKADWDVGMTVDAIGISSRVDVIVLVTGDGDFVPLVEYLHGHGVRCEVVAFSESTNSRLREVADAFLDVSQHTDDFLIRPRHLSKTADRRPHTTSSDAEPSEEDIFLPQEEETSPPRRRGPRPPPADIGGRKIRVSY